LSLRHIELLVCQPVILLQLLLFLVLRSNHLVESLDLPCEYDQFILQLDLYTKL
jgi:hypothetical protein